MNKSESIKELSTAMAGFALSLGAAVKDSANPFFKSKYADLTSVTDAIKAALGKSGLSYVQVSHNVDGGVAVETVILHSSGEWLSTGAVSVPASKQDAQGYGSALTYARRYSLAMAFGVTADDDDGNAAAKAPPKASKPITPNDAGKELWESAEAEQKSFLVDCLTAVCDSLEISPEAAAVAFYTDLKMDMEEQAAVWSQLNSKARAAIKSAKPQQKEEK